MKLVCDIHHHLRGFVVVSPTPWFRSAIAMDDSVAAVPAGRYVLGVWHEMGEPPRTETSRSHSPGILRCRRSN